MKIPRRQKSFFVVAPLALVGALGTANSADRVLKIAEGSDPAFTYTDPVKTLQNPAAASAQFALSHTAQVRTVLISAGIGQSSQTNAPSPIDVPYDIPVMVQSSTGKKLENYQVSLTGQL